MSSATTNILTTLTWKFYRGFSLDRIDKHHPLRWPRRRAADLQPAGDRDTAVRDGDARIAIGTVDEAAGVGREGEARVRAAGLGGGLLDVAPRVRVRLGGSRAVGGEGGENGVWMSDCDAREDEVAGRDSGAGGEEMEEV